MKELWQLEANEIAAMIKTKEVSAEQVALTTLDRLNHVNPSINAIVDYDADKFLDDARNVDSLIADGKDLGPLAGVPVTVKVNIDQKGFATTNGLKIQKELIATENNPVVDNLLSAGTLILGRTNTPSFSYRWFTDNLLHGATVNPHDPTLTPGGSSGGAGAAVSSGMGFLAHGTDIAGSIRYPAYACGVQGIRPSFGRVAAYNSSSPERDIGGQVMAVSGLLGRSIRDLELGLQILSYRDARDPWWVPAPLQNQEFPKKAALCLNPGGIETCQVIRQKLLQTAAILKQSGWVVEEVYDLPSFREAAELNVNLWIREGFEEKVRLAKVEQDTAAVHVLENFKSIADSTGHTDLSYILTRRASILREWQIFQKKYTIIILPTSAELPFANNLDIESEESFKRVRQAQIPQMSVPFIGVPALSVFTGLYNKVPTGVQLIASRFREDIIFNAGKVIEREFGKPEVVTPNIIII